MPLTLLFDLDGTMVDTDDHHLAAWNTVLAAHARQIDAAFYKTSIMGASNEAVISSLFPDRDPALGAAMIEAKEAAFRSMVTRLVPTAGLPELLDWADSLALRKAVVTNAPRDNAVLMLRGLGWADRFPVLVIGDELARGKPDPLPYRTAMERLGADPAGSIAFEDSRSGVRAAVAARVETVGVMTGLSMSALRDEGATIVVRNFTDPDLVLHLRRRAAR